MPNLQRLGYWPLPLGDGHRGGVAVAGTAGHEMISREEIQRRASIDWHGRRPPFKKIGVRDTSYIADGPIRARTSARKGRGFARAIRGGAGTVEGAAGQHSLLRTDLAILPLAVGTEQDLLARLLVDDPVFGDARLLVKRPLRHVVALDALRRDDLDGQIGGPSK
jgi:hypothetical protein